MTSIDELRQKLQLRDRPIALIVGAGVSSGPNGVQDAAGMVANIQHELTVRGLGRRFEREFGSSDLLKLYPFALDFVHQHAGPWLVNTLVEEAVLEARQVRTSLTSENDGRPEDWHLPRATVALARLLVQHSNVFAGPVVTTNFDPFLSLAIKAAGGRVDRRIVRSDRTLEPSGPHRGGVVLLHLHGYWRGDARTRHGRLFPMEPNMAVVALSQLRGCRILVVGHRGRPDSLMQGLDRLVNDSATPSELWWCFHAPEETARARDPQLLEQLASWRAKVLFGIDAHQLFEDLALSLGSQFGEPEIITNEIAGIELVRIPGGTFLMGSPPTEKGRHHDEGPQHELTLDDFYLARTPVTNAQYARFLEATPNAHIPECWENPRYNQPNQPVVGISLEEARAYCKWAKLDLPTEAQWEYACRARTTTPYWSGNNEASLAQVGWYEENSDGRLHDVGEKEANQFGLHDMHGNVWEWCLDKFGLYTDSPPRPKDGLRYDPNGNHTGDTYHHVLRGGSWGEGALVARSAYRNARHPGYSDNGFGFRPAQVHRRIRHR